MSDDEADPELLELLRQSLGLGPKSATAPADTKVLSSARYIYDNSIDVALDPKSTKAAAELIYKQMTTKSYSTKTWSEHELHPKVENMDPKEALNFIFTMDLLNFSFWSEKSVDERFAIAYGEKRWTGYWSLVAAMRRALDNSIPITSPSFWVDEESFSVDVLREVFKSETEEEIPLLEERFNCLKEAGTVLAERFDGDVSNLIIEAKNSASALVNLLAEHFSCFNDEHQFDRKKVRIMKRAQIFVADVWAAFNSEGYGSFDDIDKITMFADYRIPQILHTLGCIAYSPPLESAVRNKRAIETGHSWEIQLRGCSIWSVELIKQEIIRQHPNTHVNAILIDFFLYDTMKELERDGEETIPHHRTRSIWY